MGGGCIRTLQGEEIETAVKMKKQKLNIFARYFGLQNKPSTAARKQKLNTGSQGVFTRSQ